MQPTDQPNMVSGGETTETKKKQLNIPAIVLGLTTVLFAGVAIFFRVQCFTVKSAWRGDTNTTYSYTDNCEHDSADSDTQSATSQELIHNSFEIFSSNLIQNYHGYGTHGRYWYYTGTENKLGYAYAHLDEDNHLTIILNRNDLYTEDITIAEAEDIVGTYYVEIGNGGMPYFYMIDKNGNVSRTVIAEDSSGEIERIEGYDNIVTVIGSNDLCAWLIDIDGNAYKQCN